MARSRPTVDRPAIFAAALIVAVGGLIYELILGTTSSYLFGDSITSFSLTTGLTLFGMGIGSLLAAKLSKKPGINFVRNELLLSIVGGNSVLILLISFGLTQIYWVVFVLLSLVIGAAIGAEIPLLMSLIKEGMGKQGVTTLSRVLAADYFGALIASLLFPFLLLPYLGIIRTAYAVAAINTLIALYMLRRLHILRRMALGTYILAGVAVVNLIGGFIFSSALEQAINRRMYQDPVVYYKSSPYQKLVVTHFGEDTRLYLNDQLQFSTVDEARYHETLAHGALGIVHSPKKVLILGGGDGLLAREALKYDSVEMIDLVDIDAAVTNLGSEHRLVVAANQGALQNERVHVHNQDAFQFVRSVEGQYDVVIADFVDPANEKTAKLYSKEFYQMVNSVISEDGVFMTQATSPYFTPQAFWQIKRTIESAMPQKTVQPLGVNVPSFGEWGFMRSAKTPVAEGLAYSLPDGLVFHSQASLAATSLLPRDTAQDKGGAVSTLVEPKIYQTYQSDMRQWRY